MDKDELIFRARRRAMLAAIVSAHLLVAAPAALAQAPAKPARIAVLSVIGDRLLVVGSQMATGTHRDNNLRSFVDLPADDFDLTTARDLEARVRREKPAAPIVAVRSRDRGLRELQEEVLAGRRPVKDLAERLRPALQPQGITHLVLVTKHRGEARIRVANGTLGMGRLEGLGFYVDRWTPLESVDALARGSGFLAPFAYFTVTLLDLGTLGVLAQEEVQEALAYDAAAMPGAVHAWDALGAEEKTVALRQAVQRGLDTAVPRIVPKLPG